MKKRAFLITLAALLCLLCALCLTACDEEPAPTPGGNDTPTHTHVFGEWIVTTPATCVTKGIQTRVCDCGHSETQYIDTTAHQAGTEWKTDGTHHWKSCTRTGCDARVNEAAHTPAVAWSSDATNHWKVCTDCGHDMTTPVAHTYDAENTCACQHYKDAGVNFTLKNGTYAVTGYIGTATEVIIPSKYKGIAVTAIGDFVFASCSSLQSITIPASVTTIGDKAFYGCSGLQSITIPDSVTSIGNGAFYNCSGLESIIVESGNTVYHSAGNCLIETASKTLIRGCNNSVIPTDGSVTTIGSYAFYSCRSLQSITIPAGVTAIGDSVFYFCSDLQTVTFGENSQLTAIGDDAFYDCDSLQSITIPAGVTTIGDKAFYNCSSLQSITIPAGVTAIGYGAFSYCSKLTSVTFGNPDGWWVASSSTATSGTTPSATDLAKTDTAADYLTSTYRYYYWKRG